MTHRNKFLALSITAITACAAGDVTEVRAPWPEQVWEEDQFGAFFSMLATSSADINGVPIVYWYHRGPSGHVEHFGLVGHAEEACCAQVSHAVTEAGNSSEIRSWMSYGISTFSCVPAEGCDDPQALDDLVVLLNDTASAVCEGQIVGHEVAREAFTNLHEEVTASVITACEQAQREDRPVGFWHAQAEIPATVPLLDAEGRPVVIDLPLAMFEVPDSLSDKVTIDGLDRASASIENEIALLEVIVQYADQIGPTPNVIVRQTSIRELDGPVTAATLRSQVQTASDLEIWIANLGKLDNAMFEAMMKEQTDPLERKRIERALEEARNSQAESLEDIARAKSVNQAALADLQAGKSVARYQKITYSTEPNKLMEAVQAAEAQLPGLREALRDIRAMPERVAKQGESILIDAYLRGWSATFSEEKLHLEYEKWAQSPGLQEWVWAAVDDGFARKYGFERARERLLLSNIYFEVGVAKGRVHIEPHYVLGSDFIVLCEPGDRVARYESVGADQNLVSWE